MLNTITLEPQGNQTVLTLRGRPINASEDEVRFFNQMQSGVQTGFNATLEQLESYLKGKETHMNKAISVSTIVEAPLQTAWEVYTQPQHITQWNHASDDWHCPSATNDLRVGGRFSSTMAAKDGSFSFEFEGVYTRVEPHKLLAYDFGDRQAEVVFEPLTPGKTKVAVTFDLEDTNPEELQRGGWQAILENYKKHAESLAGQA